MNIKGFDERQWWIAMVIFGSAFLGAAMVAKERDLATIALGVVVFAFGEWRNHPFQQKVFPGGMTSGYPHRWTAFGTILDAIGIALIGFGGYRFLSA